jgi:hypothetical protein
MSELAKNVVKKRKNKKNKQKNGLEIKPYKSAENFETRKKIKYDSEMYQTLQGMYKIAQLSEMVDYDLQGQNINDPSKMEKNVLYR